MMGSDSFFALLDLSFWVHDKYCFLVKPSSKFSISFWYWTNANLIESIRKSLSCFCFLIEIAPSSFPS